MSDLQIDSEVPALSEETRSVAERAEELGVDRVWSRESDNDPFLPLATVAEHTTELTFGTRIALAFTRSPTTLAYTAWDLARYSEGRFVLGLGTQVKGHIERRFGMEWSAPGPRLREVVESLQHLFEVFQGERDRLDYGGDHYELSLMTENFDPGPIDHPDVPVYVAGVNEYNVRLAGELCDGLAMHPFNTPSYAEEVLAPLVAEGAERGERDPDEVALSAAPLIVTGETEAEREKRREEVRERVAFYGSTRTYHDVLDHHGWGEVGEQLHAASKDGRWDEMAGMVGDEMLSAFAVEAPPGELLSALEDAYGDAADRVVVPIEALELARGE
jgi:probable F420-dependent oxidoreductase